jgi:hypothetical protein
VVDADHVLLDDRSLVQLGGHVVRGRADQLHPALGRLPVRVGADERRQEAVVDVDRPHRELGQERRREHLHVAGQHDRVDLPAQQLQLLLFGRRLGLRRHRHDVVRDAPGLHQRA